MAQERKGAVTMRGNPLTLIGPVVKIGDKAPDFKTIDTKMQEVTLASAKGKTRIFSVIPSLDTPVCDLQTKRFNEEACEARRRGRRLHGVGGSSVRGRPLVRRERREERAVHLGSPRACRSATPGART